jgi:hypothetical protein
MSDIESKTVFAMMPNAQGDGVPVVIIGIPFGAWENLKGEKTSTFDLTKVGIPVKIALFGAETHDRAMALLDGRMKNAGVAYVDERRTDFSIKTEPDANG